MTALIAFHEVEDGHVWSKAWKKGAGSRHEMFAKINVTARTFHDPNDSNLTGLIFEVPDMVQFQSFMENDEAKKAMEEDGLKVDTIRVLSEFTP